MNVTITKNVDATRIRDLLPPRLRKAVVDHAPVRGTVTLLVFGNEVVLSGVVRRALRRRAPTEEPVVAVAQCFTEEARAELHQINALALETSTFRWTDESFTAVREIR